MPKEDWIENNVQSLFQSEGVYPSGKIDTVLDVACGLSLKSQYVDADVRVGVDIHRPFLERIESDVPYATINADVRDLDDLFVPNSFDLVLVLDIVEHLEKDEALDLLDAAEEIAETAVIVETPKGFVPQNMDIWDGGGDEYQTHRSGWKPQEFENRGYYVITRDYTMSDVKRHTEIDVDPEIEMIDAIKRLDTEVED